MLVGDGVRFSLLSLSGYPLRSAMTLLAMAIGVAAVVILTALGEGARRYVIGEFSSLGSHLLIVLPGRNETTGGAPPMFGESNRDLTIEDAQALARSALVRRVAPINVGSADISWGNREREAVVLGSSSEMQHVRQLKVTLGRFLPPLDTRQGSPVCVIGATLRNELFGTKNPLGQTLRIGDYRFRIIGVLASQGLSISLDVDEIVVIPVASAQQIFNTQSLFRILVEARSREAIPRLNDHILATIKARHEGEEDVTVITQDAVLSTFDRIFTALTLTVGGIAAISLLVAGVLIMNIMLVTVSQRTAEIGLLMAIGASPKQVQRLFLGEALLLSLLGALSGLAIGLLTNELGQRLYPQLALSPPPWAVAAAIAMALLTGLVFGALPARRASRLDPVDALARR